LSEQANGSGSKCPLSRSLIERAGLVPISICLSYGIGAYEAALKYPAHAPNVFALYGEEEAFRRIFSQYGHQVVPVIAYYVEHGSTAFEFRRAIDETLQQIWSGHRPPSFQP